MLRNKNGVVSETLVWIISTIIIIVVMISFLYMASLIGEKTRIFEAKNELASDEGLLGISVLAENSVYSYFLIEDELLKEKIYYFYEDNEEFRKKLSELGRGIE